MKGNDTIHLRRAKDNLELRMRFEQFVKDWEAVSVDSMKEYIRRDAVIDFSIFDRGLDREEFIAKLSYRPRETTWVRFDPYNYVCLFNEEKAQMTAELILEFTSAEDTPQEFCAAANFVASLVKEGEHDWKFSELRLNLQEDDLIIHPVLTSKGIAKDKWSGDRSFVSNWYMHDDRIGWFENKRQVSVVPELDMPWYAIPDPVYLGSDEEQIERAIFAYYYGVDQIMGAQFIDYAFNEDAMIIYADGTPLTLREELDAMRSQIQGSPRVCHVAKVTDIQIDGDRAIVKTYNRHMCNEDFADPLKREWRCAWARYRFVLTKRKGMWKIDRLNYYPANFVAER